MTGQKIYGVLAEVSPVSQEFVERIAECPGVRLVEASSLVSSISVILVADRCPRIVSEVRAQVDGQIQTV